MSTNYELSQEEKLLLYALSVKGGEPISGKTAFQKLIFLITNVFGEEYEDLFNFEPHLLGPYSDVVDNVLEDLAKLGLVDSKGTAYFLTGKGADALKAYRPAKELVEVVSDFKDFLSGLNEDELLTFIYVSFPDYISESVRWDDLKNRRERFALSLFKKGKISFEKGAEIAGIGPLAFEGLLKKSGVKWR